MLGVDSRRTQHLNRIINHVIPSVGFGIDIIFRKTERHALSLGPCRPARLTDSQSSDDGGCQGLSVTPSLKSSFSWDVRGKALLYKTSQEEQKGGWGETGGVHVPTFSKLFFQPLPVEMKLGVLFIKGIILPSTTWSVDVKQMSTLSLLEQPSLLSSLPFSGETAVNVKFLDATFTRRRRGVIF